MKIISTFLFIFLSLCAFADSWIQKTDFGGTARHAAAGFFLNGKGYIGTGGTFASRKKDFWEWDPLADTWTQKADFGGASRSGSVGFAVNSRGYILTGFSTSARKDIWEYDPSSNSWTQKTDLGGAGRHFSVAFEMNGYGYIGTGDGGGNLDDFWQYDAGADVWTQKADFGGSPRSSATGFSVNGKGYIGTGFGTSTALADFWEYDPSANSWTQKANFGGGARSDAVSFTLCDKGYVATGVSSASADKNDLWEYDPTSDTWTQKATFGGAGREDAVAFSDGTYGYVGTGTNVFNEFGDFWQYAPDCIILPIELQSFSAKAAGEKIFISWTTASEVNNNYFTLEKSIDGENFEFVAQVAGKGTCITASSYQAIDDHPNVGINYYRLKQTDFDGSFTYSHVITCESENKSMQVLSVNPNPIETNITVNIDASDNEDVMFQLFDEQGKKVFSKVMLVNEGIHSINLSLPDLRKGIFVIYIHCEYGHFSQKLTKLE